MLTEVARHVGNVLSGLLDAHLLVWLSLDHDAIIILLHVLSHGLVVILLNNSVDLIVVQIQSFLFDLFQSLTQIMGLDHQVLLLLTVELTVKIGKILCC